MRWLIFSGLAAFVPLVYYLAVVGGLLPLGGILLMTLRNATDSSFLVLGLAHLLPYGALLYWLAGWSARIIMKVTGQIWWATAAVLLLLAGIGAMPIFGVAHGHVEGTSAYELYTSGRLR